MVVQPTTTLPALCRHRVVPVLMLLILQLTSFPWSTWAAPGRSFRSSRLLNFNSSPRTPSSPSSHSTSRHLLSASSGDSGDQSQPSLGGDPPPQDALARLSQVFGIARIPRHSIHRSPPQFMKEMYQDISGIGGLSRKAGPYNSNVIRSFPDKGEWLL